MFLNSRKYEVNQKNILMAFGGKQTELLDNITEEEAYIPYHHNIISTQYLQDYFHLLMFTYLLNSSNIPIIKSYFYGYYQTHRSENNTFSELQVN